MTSRKRRMARVGNQIGVWMYRTLNGRLSSGSKNVNVLMITTPAVVPAPALDLRAVPRKPAGLVVWGTGSGSRHDPDWFQNLREADTALVQVRQREFMIRPHELHGEERDTMWRATILARGAGVSRYAKKAGRAIPVAVLEPVQLEGAPGPRRCRPLSNPRQSTA